MKIHEYMKMRATSEDQGFSLTDDWFSSAMGMGCRLFFGVEVDAEGNVVSDMQNPDFYKEVCGK